MCTYEYGSNLSSRWDVRRLGEEAWAMLDERTQVWEVSKSTLGLAGETTTKYLQEELQGFEFEAVLGEDGKMKLRPRPKRCEQ